MPQRRLVVQVIANLAPTKDGPAGAADRAMRTVLHWLRTKQRVALPDSADRGDPFEIDAADGLPLCVERAGNLWGLQFDKFDPRVPGRTWRTEATVGFTDGAALVGVRLSVLDAQPQFDSVFSIPRLVTDLIRSPGLLDYGHRLTDKPETITNDLDVERLLQFLRNKSRTRPIVVFSESPDEDALADAQLAAKRLAALAHVLYITTTCARSLTDALGRDFSVWNGAVRTYNPGFSAQLDERTAHPIATREWISRRFAGIDRFVSMLAVNAAARSVRGPEIDTALPPFRAIKTAAIERRISRLRSSAAAQTETEQLLSEENASLKLQLKESQDAYSYAADEVQTAEAERDQYRAIASSLRQKVSLLEDRLGTGATVVEVPTSFDGIDKWVLENFPGRVILLNRAARTARKSPFGEPGLVYRCIARLGREYVDARRSGTPVDRLFEDLGVHLERTGDPARLAQWRDEYFVPHRGRSQFLEWHLKRGSDKNEVNTMRIYFFFDEDDEQVIIGHLPSHLTNSVT